MTEKPVLILYYLPTSTYALNVLLGALESKGLDLRVQVFLPRSMRHLTEIVEGLNTENVVILWSFFSAAFPNAREHLDSLRQKNLGCRPINIAGGVHASAEPKQVLLSGFDFVAVGEGEQIVVDIVYTLLASRDFQQVHDERYVRRACARDNCVDFIIGQYKNHNTRAVVVEILESLLYQETDEIICLSVLDKAYKIQETDQSLFSELMANTQSNNLSPKVKKRIESILAHRAM